MKAEFVDIRFEKLIPGVRDGQFDVIASTLYAKTERELQIDFVPYMRTGISIAASTGSGFLFKRPEDLCDRKVGSIKGAAWLEKLVVLNNVACYAHPVKIREYPTSPAAMQALLSGEIDAQVEDSAVLQDAVSKLGGRVAITSTDNFYPVVVVLGVRKGNNELSDVLRRGIRKLQANGCYSELLRKYNVSKPRLAEFYLPLEDIAATQGRKHQGLSNCNG